MKLLFKQRFFSWFDSYDIYDENGDPMYVVKGQFAWGHRLKIFDASGIELGVVQERIFTFLPKFEMCVKGEYIGCICRKFSFFKPKYVIECNNWQVEGNFLQWDYDIVDGFGRRIATISKELLNWTDTYSIDVQDPKDALCVLMLTIAIDAEKCSRGNVNIN